MENGNIEGGSGQPVHVISKPAPGPFGLAVSLTVIYLVITMGMDDLMTLIPNLPGVHEKARMFLIMAAALMAVDINANWIDSILSGRFRIVGLLVSIPILYVADLALWDLLHPLVANIIH